MKPRKNKKETVEFLLSGKGPETDAQIDIEFLSWQKFHVEEELKRKGD